MSGRINDPSTGGTTDYYLIEVKHPRRQETPFKVDVDDLSAALKPTPEEFNILKAIVRSANARNGKGKPGYDDLDARIRDAKKMKHYAECNLKILLDEQEDTKPQPAPQEPTKNEEAGVFFPWVMNTGRRPENVGVVEVETRDGARTKVDPYKENWRTGISNAIVQWRRTED